MAVLFPVSTKEGIISIGAQKKAVYGQIYNTVAPSTNTALYYSGGSSGETILFPYLAILSMINSSGTISLTTTGTSGASTLTGTVLNIPIYQAQGNYLVYGGAVTTGHNNEVLYIDGSGNLASDSGFIRDIAGSRRTSVTNISGGNSSSWQNSPSLNVWEYNDGGSGFITGLRFQNGIFRISNTDNTVQSQWLWPQLDGTNGQVLSTDGSGNLSFITVSSGGGTVTSVTLANGTGITLSGTNPITTSGTITITNSLPDQTVVLNNGTGISVTGTYPNFTITNTSPSSGGTVTSISVSGANGIVVGGSPITSSGTIALTLGTLTGVTISGASNTLTNIANASLTNSSITINGSAVSLGGSVTVGAAPTGSAGGDLTGTYPNPTIKASVGLTGSPTTPNQTALSNNTLIANANYVDSVPYCTRVDFPPQNTSSRPQGTWILSFNGSQPGAQLFANTTAAINDNVTYNFTIFKGSAYILRLTYFGSTNTGIFTFLIDGVSIGTIDSYNAGGANFGAIASITGITITSGLHVLTVKGASKNGASSGFELFYSCLEIFT